MENKKEGRRSRFDGITLTSEQLLAARDGGEKNFRGVNLSGNILAGKNLSDIDLGDANLSDANLSGSNLNHVNFSFANLIGANLRGAFLFRASLSGANLCGANLNGTDLSFVPLGCAQLIGADINEANLSFVDLSQVGLSLTFYGDSKVTCNLALPYHNKSKDSFFARVSEQSINEVYAQRLRQTPFFLEGAISCLAHYISVKELASIILGFITPEDLFSTIKVAEKTVDNQKFISLFMSYYQPPTNVLGFPVSSISGENFKRLRQADNPKGMAIFHAQRGGAQTRRALEAMGIKVGEPTQADEKQSANKCVMM